MIIEVFRFSMPLGTLLKQVRVTIKNVMKKRRDTLSLPRYNDEEHFVPLFIHVRHTKRRVTRRRHVDKRKVILPAYLFIFVQI